MPASPVLVIGLDGATYDLLTPLCGVGVMPNLAQLMQTATLAELASTRPFITPVAWSSFQTGCDPEEHGVWDYRYLDAERRQVCLNDHSRLRRPTLFDAVAEQGGETVSLNLPMTYPAPSAPGIFVGGLDSPSIAAAMSSCPQFAHWIHARQVPFSLSTIWKRVPRTYEELSQQVERTATDFHGRATAAEIADSMSAWQLMIVQFQTLDALQHRCWHLLIESTDDVPDAWKAVPDAWKAKACQAMQALDQALGRLLELADRRGASVAVVSDHGFGPFRGKISLPTLLESRGLLVRSSQLQSISGRIARAGWKARKWLRRRLRRGASTASLERPISMLAPIDWQASRALALHGNLAALVYLNSRDRFGRGALTSASQVDQARDETIAALREATHPESGEPLFDEVFATHDRFGCDPIQRQWPDVIGIPAAGFHTRTRFDSEGQLLLGDAELTGTHRQSGVLMVDCRGNAPAVGSERQKPNLSEAHQAALRDVAPTLLRLMGIDKPAAMSGRVLDELLIPRGGPPNNPPVRDVVPVPCPTLSAAEQETVEARLRDLGYLD